MKRPVEHDPNLLRLEGPAPVVDIAKDLVKRGAILAPVGIVVGALIWGAEGAYSVAYALVLVAINFLMAAFMLAYAGRISAAAMGAAAVFGFFTRLSIITVAVLAVRTAPLGQPRRSRADADHRPRRIVVLGDAIHLRVVGQPWP